MHVPHSQLELVTGDAGKRGVCTEQPWVDMDQTVGTSEMLSLALSGFADAVEGDSSAASQKNPIAKSRRAQKPDSAVRVFGASRDSDVENHPTQTEEVVSLDWLKLLQGVTLLQVNSKLEGGSAERDERANGPTLSDAALACDKGRWLGLRELARRAMFGTDVLGDGGTCRDPVSTSSLSHAVSRVLNDEDAETTFLEEKQQKNSSLLLRAVRVDFFESEKIQHDAAAERRKRHARFGLGARGGAGAGVPGAGVPDVDAGDAREDGGPNEEGFVVTAAAANAVATARAGGTRSDSDGSALPRMASSTDIVSRRTETVTKPLLFGYGIFGGDDAFLLAEHPFAFFVETLARLGWNVPGVFSGKGGYLLVQKIASGVILGILKMKLTEMPGCVSAERLGGQETSIVSINAGLSRLCRNAVHDVWRVETLLALVRGDSKSPESGYGQSGPVRCVTRVLSRLGLGTVESVAFALVKHTRRAAEADGAVDGANAETAEVSVDDSNETPDVHSTNPGLTTVTWSSLPDRHEDALLRCVDTKCARCLLKPRDPAVCLNCGTILCCADTNCRAIDTQGSDRNSDRLNTLSSADDEAAILGGGLAVDRRPGQIALDSSTRGACAEHACKRECGAGSCCFLLLKSTRVLIIHSNGKRVCIHPSFYRDAHGEEDEHMKRGRPLFLDRETVANLRKLWERGALEHDTAATGGSRLGGEWY